MTVCPSSRVRRWIPPLAATALVFGAAHAGATAPVPQEVITAPDFVGGANPADETVATFDFAPLAFASIGGVTISGDWGNASQGEAGDYFGSANTSLYADGVLVATCHSWDPCWGNGSGPVAWSYTFDAADWSKIADGHVSLWSGPGEDGFTYGVNVLSGMQLAIAPVPEPGSVALMLAGLGALGLAQRRRRAR